MSSEQKPGSIVHVLNWIGIVVAQCPGIYVPKTRQVVKRSWRVASHMLWKDSIGWSNDDRNSIRDTGDEVLS